MEELQFLVESNKEIHEVEISELQDGEPCISLMIGTETNQQEVVFSQTDLIKMLNATVSF